MELEKGPCAPFLEQFDLLRYQLKTFAVPMAGAQFSDGAAVFGSWVAHILVPAIGGEFSMTMHHSLVAVRFG